MQSSKILLKDGQTVDLVDGRIDDGDIASWNNKPNVTITSENDSVNISTSVDAETNTKTFDLSVDSLNITSSDGSINVSTSEGVTDLTLPNDVVRDSNYVHIDGATEVPLIDGNASAGVSTKYAREDHVHPTDTSREASSNKTTVILGTSHDKYPTDKAVAEFVNSSIATNTANYISNNGEPFTSVEQLEAYSGPVTNNDYAFVTGIDSEGNTYYDRYKATVSGSTVTWSLEYRLNNSSFTAAQWSAINSGITSVLVAKIHEHGNKAVLDGITSSDVANWNSKMDNQSAGNISEPVYIENGIAKIATNVATIGNLDEKLNVDGSNATIDGVTTMLKTVPVIPGELSSTSQIFASMPGSREAAKKPISALAAYIKNDIGSAGSTETPIYLENGVPKVCTLVGVPYTFVNYGNANGYGVFVGGNTKLENTTRCSCTFLVSVSSNPDLMMHTYIGTFSFRGDLSNKVNKKELRCLTGAPQYPLRIAVAYNEDGQDSNGKPTYSVGLFVIPADKSYRYSTYRLTRIASSGFKWDVKKLSEVDYDNCNSGAKSASTVIVSSDGVFNSISKSESKTNGCTLKFGATDGSSKSITVKNAVEADKIDGYHISVGTTVGTDPNTIYIVNAS